MIGKNNLILRKNIRYQTNIHAQCSCSQPSLNQVERLRDISVDGLSFLSSIRYDKGMLLTIQIPVTPPFQALARVIWCRQHKNHYYVGVKFLQIENGFRINTVEQINHLEQNNPKYHLDEMSVM
jgi:hypothetical protein